MKKTISKIISNILNLSAIEIESKIEIPPQKQMGDFAFPTFFLTKTLRKNPNKIATEIVEKIGDNEIFKKIEIKGAYINFFLNDDIYNEIFKKIENEKIENPENQKQTIFIDYIGPNVGKPMHIGHMCTPNIGQTIINIYRKLGYNVISDSHIGDWGIIFGKLITAYKLRGNSEKLETNAVDYLLELYVKITKEIGDNPELDEEPRKEFKKLSNGDKESIEYREQFTSLSIKEMRKQLKRLNVQQDFDIGESFYEGLNLPKLQNYPDLKFSMKDVTKELIEKKIATENEDGSVGVVFENDKLPSCILMKRNSTFGYFASDLAAVKYRVENRNPDKIIYFIDNRQSLHLKQVFEVSKQAGRISNTELIHAGGGFVQLKTGAMSSRKGNIIKLNDLLDEATKRAGKILEEKGKIENTQDLQEIIGIGAIKYEYLRKNRELDLIFDRDEFMKFEGNSAPYIMYTYTRGNSILQKSDESDSLIEKINFQEQEEFDLIKKLSEYKELLQQTIKENYPHILANWTYELTKTFNLFYTNINILNEEDKIRKASKLKLTKLSINTIKDAFENLGIKMPDKM